MLNSFTPRLYQETIVGTAALKNTLVVIPTGMGKTGIALLLAAQRLRQHPSSKILIVTPTKPLAEQHVTTFQEKLNVPSDRIVLFTGAVAPEKREALWKDAQVVLATPQGVENDILTRRIDFKDVSLLVFDEAHRATGDYSYVFLAKQYEQVAKYPRILALTASPGSELEKIEEVCKNLHIEAIEVRTEEDLDVQPYIQQVDVAKKHIQLPDEFKKVQACMQTCINERVRELKGIGINAPRHLSKAELLRMQRQLQARMASGERDFDVFKGLSLIAEIMKAQHALELLETQSVQSAHKYLDNLFATAHTSTVKAVKNLTSNVAFKSAYVLTQSLVDKGIEHPKVHAVVEQVKKELAEKKTAKIILFTQYREMGAQLEQALQKQNVLARLFVGQMKKGKTGLSQKEQKALIDEFRDGMFSVLIATSVAEEGLDIPSVDTVLFYEPIPSAIRSIQRRGRTGRLEKGKVMVFITKGTRDEGYSWSARAKEKKMKQTLQTLNSRITMRSPQKTLPTYENITLFADYREKGSGVVKELLGQGVTPKLEMLPIADYVLSSRVGVELKTAEDFVNSIIDGRLLEQIKGLRMAYERPVLIIQGTEDLYTLRNMSPNAIRGMLATIAVSYGIPVLRTKDGKDTAAQLIAIAKREQEKDKKDFSPHADRKPVSLKEQQEYLVSALPQVGPSLAKELLKHFKSVHGVFTADETALQQVPGVGEKIAQAIRQLVDSSYN